MKNLNIYKRTLALVTSASMLLLSGCSGGTNNTKDISKQGRQDEYCLHFTVYFEDKPVTFKACDGYDVNYEGDLKGGLMKYGVSKDGNSIIRNNSYTSNFNAYYVNHNNADEIIDHPSAQKSK